MVQWIADRESLWNTRLVCVECLETTWKEGEMLLMYHYQEQKAGFNKHIRWWTCKGCW